MLIRWQWQQLSSQIDNDQQYCRWRSFGLSQVWFDPFLSCKLWNLLVLCMYCNPLCSQLPSCVLQDYSWTLKSQVKTAFLVNIYHKVCRVTKKRQMIKFFFFFFWLKQDKVITNLWVVIEIDNIIINNFLIIFKKL